MDLLINGAFILLGLILFVILCKIAFKIILWVLPVALACWLIGLLFSAFGWVGVLMIVIILMLIK